MTFGSVCPIVAAVQGALLMLALATASQPDSVRIDFSPSGPWVLTEITTLELDIHAPEPAGPLRPLRLSSNIGSFSEVTRVEAGRYRAQYTLPSTRHPQVAVIALWRETGPDARIDFRTIDLWGKTKLKVRVRAGSEVSVEVGGKTFGPVTADRRGRAEVPIEVPPGVLEVTVRSLYKKRRSELKVPVEVPPYNRLALAVTPYKIPADGSSKATVHAYYVGTAPGTVQIAAPEGSVSPPKPAGSNRFIANYAPNRSTEVKQVELTVQAKDRARSKANVLLELGRPVAESVLVSAIEPFYAGLGSRRVKVTVFDRAGLGVEGLTVRTQVATSSPTVATEIGNGDYEIQLTPPREYTDVPVSLKVSASRPDAPTFNAIARLAIEAAPWPASIEVKGIGKEPVADPEQPLQVAVVALDAKGQPVANRQLSLQAEGAVLENTTVEGAQIDALVRLQEDAEQLTLSVLDAEGPKVSRSFALTPARIGLSVGGFAGLRLQSALAFALGLELGYRPNIADRRLLLSVAGGVERLSRKLEVVGPAPVIEADGTLLTVPIMLGVSFDLYAGKNSAVYLRAEGGIGFWGSRTRIDSFEANDSGLAYGGGGVVGFSIYGVYIELLARGLNYASDQTTIPTFGVGTSLGYRFGL